MRVFKGETVFDWESEPASERPSAFAESTQQGRAGPSSRRGPASTLEVARPRPPRKQGGIGTTWVVAILGLAVAAGAFIGYVKMRPAASAARVVLGPPAPSDA